MIGEDWPRVAAIAVEANGDIAAVWTAFERATDTVHLYDACKLNHEALAIIAEALNARGRFIPVAWSASSAAIAKDLLNRGCNMMYDQADESEAMTEVITRTIWERMRTARFRVERRLAEWLEEMKKCQFDVGGKIPREGFPLMAATRAALQMLDRGRASPGAVTRRKLFPNIAVV